MVGVRSSRVRFRLRLDADDRRWVLFLLAAASLSESSVPFFKGADGAWGTAVGFMFALVLSLAPLSAVAVALGHSRVLLWTGRWLGGQATARHLHAAQAWAALPVAGCAPLALADFGLAWRAAIAPGEAAVLAPWRAVADPLVEIAIAVAASWSCARYVVYLSEAQRFSKLRAVGNQLLAALVLLAAFAAAGAFVHWAA